MKLMRSKTRERGRRGETEGVDETQVKKTKMKNKEKHKYTGSLV